MKITLDDVVGLNHHKKVFREMLFLKKENQNLYQKIIKQPEKIKERKNFLLTGPSGSGKTYLVKAVANEANISITILTGSELSDKFIGEGEKRLRELYSKKEDHLIIIDEAEDIFKNRTADSKTNGIVNQMLYCLDGGYGNYNIITTLMSNKPLIFDNALISRIPLQNRLYFPKPNLEQKKKIFQKQLSYHNYKENIVDDLIHLTENWDSRNIEDLFSYARNHAIKSKRDYLTSKDFEEFFKRDRTYEWRAENEL